MFHKWFEEIPPPPQVRTFSNKRTVIDELPKYGLVASFSELRPYDEVLIPGDYYSDKQSIDAIFFDAQCEHINDIAILKGYRVYYYHENTDTIIGYRQLPIRRDLKIISIDGTPIND